MAGFSTLSSPHMLQHQPRVFPYLSYFNGVGLIDLVRDDVPADQLPLLLPFLRISEAYPLRDEHVVLAGAGDVCPHWETRPIASPRYLDL